MNSTLTSGYAIVEQVQQTHMDEKIFTIDINKCRRNILLNHKHNYCVLMLWMTMKSLILIQRLLKDYIILNLINFSIAWKWMVLSFFSCSLFR